MTLCEELRFREGMHNLSHREYSGRGRQVNYSLTGLSQGYQDHSLTVCQTGESILLSSNMFTEVQNQAIYGSVLVRELMAITRNVTSVG